MPTVTALLDRGSRVTGLRTTGTERALALEALQDAYRRAVLDAECYPELDSYTFVASSDNYSLLTMLGKQPGKLMHVTLNASTQPYHLQQVSHQELLDMRAAEDASGTPFYYAVIGFDRIAFYPNPAIGNTTDVWYQPDTLILHETVATSGVQETTPSMIPVQFHWSVLFPGMVLEMLDKDQRIAESQTWQARYDRGIARLQEHIGQMGGNANRAYATKGRGFSWRSDERRR